MRTGIDSSRCASMRFTMHGSESRSPPLLSLLTLLRARESFHFLPFRFFYSSLSFAILSRAFGIDRAAVDSFIVHRVVYLPRLPGFSPLLGLYYRTICEDNASHIIGKVRINAIEKSKARTKNLMRSECLPFSPPLSIK